MCINSVRSDSNRQKTYVSLYLSFGYISSRLLETLRNRKFVYKMSVFWWEHINVRQNKKKMLKFCC